MQKTIAVIPTGILVVTLSLFMVPALNAMSHSDLLTVNEVTYRELLTLQLEALLQEHSSTWPY